VIPAVRSRIGKYKIILLPLDKHYILYMIIYITFNSGSKSHMTAVYLSYKSNKQNAISFENDVWCQGEDL